MDVVECKNCGAAVDDAWSVCPACGAVPSVEPAGRVAHGDVFTGEEASRPVADEKPPARETVPTKPRSITPFWTVDGLLEEYPFLLDFLTSYRCLGELDEPEGRRRAGRMILGLVAKRSDVQLDQLLRDIAAEVERKTGTRPPVEDVAEPAADTGPWYWKAVAVLIGIAISLLVLSSLMGAGVLPSESPDDSTGRLPVLLAAFTLLLAGGTWLAALVLHRVFGRRIQENALVSDVSGCLTCFPGCLVGLVLGVTILALLVVIVT